MTLREMSVHGRRDALKMLAAAPLCGLLSGAHQPAAGRPNVLFILADDLGFADLSIYGRPDYETPRLDRLAREGVLLTNAYANSCVCSPTRFALITGRYQYRFRGGAEEPLRGSTEFGLQPDVETLPGQFLRAGYATGLIGKWHLGLPPHFSPLRSGYQRFFGTLGGAIDYFTHKDDNGNEGLYDGERLVERNGYLTDLLVGECKTWLREYRRSGQPFFLSLHPTAPHWPWEAPGDEALSRTLRQLVNFDGGSLRTYARMMTHLDSAVGEVLDELERQGLAENTIVVFTSDNGGERFSHMWPLSGEKGDLLEGGIRVPAIVRWPAAISAVGTRDQVAITMDWAPTLLDAAGIEGRMEFDGRSILAALQGAAPGPRNLFWRMKGRSQAAVRSGHWKYLRIGENEYLFDLAQDERERANRAQAELATFAMLKAMYRAWERTMPPIPEDASAYTTSGAHDPTRN